VNAEVDPMALEFSVQSGKPTSIAFIVKPLRANETLCVLVEVDGDRARKWELSAVAE